MIPLNAPLSWIDERSQGVGVASDEAPATHEPSQQVVSAVPVGIGNASGMTPYGPSHPDYPNAPSDWDGGPYLCRDGGLYHMRGYGWEHGLGCWNPAADWDRVAYTATNTNAGGL